MTLARPCPGRRIVGPRQSANQGGRNGLLQQLRNLKKGLHPKTGVLLPPPVQIDPSLDVPAEMAALYSSQHGRTYGLAAPESLSPPLQAMLERARKRQADMQLVAPSVKRRISVKTSPNVSNAGRNSLLSPTLTSDYCGD